jgi:predicted RNase H-like HicB family nuclease
MEVLMKKIRYVYWQDGEFWLGYFEEYPDYVTQGMSLQELGENLTDLYKDLTGGEIPGIRRVGELQVA